jgi:hypothetical protein
MQVAFVVNANGAKPRECLTIYCLRGTPIWEMSTYE